MRWKKKKKAVPKVVRHEELGEAWQLTRAKVLDAFAKGHPLRELKRQLNDDRAYDHLGRRGCWTMPLLRAIIWDAQGIAPLTYT